MHGNIMLQHCYRVRFTLGRCLCIQVGFIANLRSEQNHTIVEKVGCFICIAGCQEAFPFRKQCQHPASSVQHSADKKPHAG